MFAFALWDRDNRELALARDRTGEKPLYVGWVGGAIVFGSEIRALRQHPAWLGGVDSRALGLMLKLGYVPAPLSIHPRVYKLPAASLLRLRSSDAEAAPTAETFASRCERYWNLEGVALAARSDPWRGSREQALDTLQELLDSSVARRMIADVPLGALLSGGIDSTPRRGEHAGTIVDPRTHIHRRFANARSTSPSMLGGSPAPSHDHRRSSCRRPRARDRRTPA
jgi:asparagine synthase (glutamine-hydrolysing)